MMIKKIILTLCLLLAVSGGVLVVSEATCDKEVAPAAPQNVVTSAGDGVVNVTWTPGNEGCVDSYIVRAGKRLGSWVDASSVREITTSDNTASFKDNIENGFLYAISVEATSAGNDNTEKVIVTATPSDNECKPGSPGPAQKVSAVSEGGSIKLCWSPPISGGCVDEYRVAARIVPLTNQEMSQLRWDTRKFDTAGCVIYDNLLDRRTYQFAIQTYSNAARSGSIVGASATVFKQWKCFPVSNYYPICEKAAVGQCNPMSCEEQLKSKQCDSPWLRERDEKTKTVTQYCADYCGCAIELDSERKRRLEGSSEPQVMAMDSDIDIYGGCCREA